MVHSVKVSNQAQSSFLNVLYHSALETKVRLLYFVLIWQSHCHTSLGHFIFALNAWFILGNYCYVASKWMDVNSRSQDTAVLLPGHCSNGLIGLVYMQFEPVQRSHFESHNFKNFFCEYMCGGGFNFTNNRHYMKNLLWGVFKAQRCQMTSE